MCFAPNTPEKGSNQTETITVGDVKVVKTRPGQVAAAVLCVLNSSRLSWDGLGRKEP